MLIYVAHAYQGVPFNKKRARKIVHDLQVADLDNCYICPLLSLSFLEYGEIGWEQEMALCLDILSVCDELLVASEVSPGIQEEIDFAKLVGMEVRFLEC